MNNQDSSSDKFRLALVSMPWALFNRPSIQLGALKAYLDQDPLIHTDLLHPYLATAKAIGTNSYHSLAKTSWAGEALYSALLFPEHASKAGKLFKTSTTTIAEPLDFYATVDILDTLLDQWIQDLHPEQYNLIGFSVCFNQLLASLAAATRIKKIHPDLPIIFGGSSCVDEIGHSLLRTFAAIDYIIHGEGEIPLHGLCHFLHHDKQGQQPSGVSTRNRPAQSTSPEIKDINTLPQPLYTSYFKEMQDIFPGQPFIPVIPVEFSRGCWWNKCTFCNLNLQWCGYRWKQADKIYAEIKSLAQKHQCLDFTFTDNALPIKESDHFFQAIAAAPEDYHFFAEIRAITKKQRLQLYNSGGLKSVQVGIEALSNTLLQRLNKGTTVIKNIATMKYCAACNIELQGNLIIEFPGSTAEEIAETLVNLDFVLAYHPLITASFFLGYGSPVHQNPEKYGLCAITRHSKNSRLFPKKYLDNMTMLVQDYRGDRIVQRKQWQPVAEKIRIWQELHRKNRENNNMLSYRDGSNFLLIRQQQVNGTVLQHRLKGLSRRIYLFCDEIRTLEEITTEFPTLASDTIHNFLIDLSRKKLLYFADNNENHQYLALAIRKG